jgi:hypothetical protein
MTANLFSDDFIDSPTPQAISTSNSGDVTSLAMIREFLHNPVIQTARDESLAQAILDAKEHLFSYPSGSYQPITTFGQTEEEPVKYDGEAAPSATPEDQIEVPTVPQAPVIAPESVNEKHDSALFDWQSTMANMGAMAVGAISTVFLAKYGFKGGAAKILPGLFKEASVEAGVLSRSGVQLNFAKPLAEFEGVTKTAPISQLSRTVDGQLVSANGRRLQAFLGGGGLASLTRNQIMTTGFGREDETINRSLLNGYSMTFAGLALKKSPDFPIFRPKV